MKRRQPQAEGEGGVGLLRMHHTHLILQSLQGKLDKLFHLGVFFGSSLKLALEVDKQRDSQGDTCTWKCSASRQCPASPLYSPDSSVR